MWNLQNKTNEYKYKNRETHIYRVNKLGVTSEEREGKQSKIGGRGLREIKLLGNFHE